MNNPNDDMQAPKMNIIFTNRTGNKINLISEYTEKIKDLIKRYEKKCSVSDKAVYLYNTMKINKESDQTVSDFFRGNVYPSNLVIVHVIDQLNINFSAGDIGFIKSKQKCEKKYYGELHGVLKLCLLKEISSKLDDNQLGQLPNKINLIISILKNSDINAKFIENQELKDDIKNEIKELLKKIEGMNVITFSKYLDESINKSQIEQIKNLLYPYHLEEIEDIKNRLGQFDEEVKKFEEEFERAKRESIFEFSVTSIIIMERDDLLLFEKERENCPNREDRMLYHGTSPKPIAEILTNFFKIGRCNQHGRGIYFTDQLDYCWFYGGKTNRENVDNIPRINNKDEDFTMIASSIYYNKKKINKVKDHLYDPKKNEINLAYADASTETLIEPDEKKFYGTEYVIKEFSQICPFISLKLKRNEYCVIWRDPSFSSKAIYGNEFDEIFKKFLKERNKYINKMAKFNVYACESSEEALKLVKRKRYKETNILKGINDNNFNLFEFAAERLISALKLSIVKIKSKKGTLFNNDIEENSSENRTAGITMESSQDKLKELENISPSFEKRNINFPNPSSLSNKFENKNCTNNILSNEPTLKNIYSVKKHDDDEPFYNENKFAIEDNLRDSQYRENDLCSENLFNFSSSPNKNLNSCDYYFTNNPSHEFDDVNNI